MYISVQHDGFSFNSVSFEIDTNVGYVCEQLNMKIGCVLWHDTFKIQNTKWLWLVNGIVAGMNNDKLRNVVWFISGLRSRNLKFIA
jgi:hypothetical protein